MLRSATGTIFLILSWTAWINAQSHSYVATPQRPTFTSNTSITAPGTLEIEFGMSSTTSSGGFMALPVMLKFTPDITSGILRNTELSVSFESLESDFGKPETKTGFGDALLFTMRRPVWSRDSFSVAVAPLAEFVLGDTNGIRLGLLGVTSYSSGLDSVVANFSFLSSPLFSANKGQEYDFAIDYSHTMGLAGTASRIGVFVGILIEKSKQMGKSISMSEGITYRMRPNLILDVAIVENGLAGGTAGYEVLAGLTVNLGRLSR